MIDLQEGAILVADAHYASYRPQFKILVDKIVSGEIKTTQLILMGDIFDLLMAPIGAFVKMHKEMIQTLNTLSQNIELIYLEGNHDFQLKKLFPNMKVYPLSQQPVPSVFHEHEGYLAHGDWGLPLSYQSFSFILRSRPFLSLLNLIDKLTFRSLSRFVIRVLKEKKICSSFDTFEIHIKNKFSLSKPLKGWFVEGHYHQGNKYKLDEIIYQNLTAMACNKSYFVVQSSKYDVDLTAFTL